MRMRHFFFLSFLFFFASAASWAQAPGPPAPSIAKPSITKPSISKIDPPGWFAGLPDPMLLVQGEGLEHARFTLSGQGVTLDRTQASENGHWAFLWLKTARPRRKLCGSRQPASRARRATPFNWPRARAIQRASRFFLRRRALSHHDRPLRRREPCQSTAR